MAGPPTSSQPLSTAALPASFDPPRRLPLSTTLSVLTQETWLILLIAMFSVSYLGGLVADHPIRTAFRETVDVPGKVVHAEYASWSTGKYSHWRGQRVRARFEFEGRTWTASGYTGNVRLGAQVKVRVPVHRPDLAVAFAGQEPFGNPNLDPALLCVFAFGLVMAPMMVVFNLRHLRLLRQGRLVRARIVQKRAIKHARRLKVSATLAIPTPQGTVHVERQLTEAQGARLTGPETWLLYDPSDLARVVSLVELSDPVEPRADGSLSGVCWLRVLPRLVPFAAFGSALAQALTTSRLLPPG